MLTVLLLFWQLPIKDELKSFVVQEPNASTDISALLNVLILQHILVDLYVKLKT